MSETMILIHIFVSLSSHFKVGLWREKKDGSNCKFYAIDYDLYYIAILILILIGIYSYNSYIVLYSINTNLVMLIIIEKLL